MFVIHHFCLKDIYMSNKHYVTCICCVILNNIQILFKRPEHIYTFMNELFFGHLLLRMHYSMAPPGLDPEEGSQRFIFFLVGLLVFRSRAVTFKSEGCVFLVRCGSTRAAPPHTKAPLYGVCRVKTSNFFLYRDSPQNVHNGHVQICVK